MIEGATVEVSLLATVFFTSFALGLKASLWKLSFEMSTGGRSEYRLTCLGKLTSCKKKYHKIKEAHHCGLLN